MRRISPRSLWVVSVSTVFASLATLGTAFAASFELPPLNTPPSTEHHVGKVVWADLVTPDLNGAEKFYGELFGWHFETVRAGDSDYVVAMLDGLPVAGLMQKPIATEERKKAAWLTFIAVRDVEATKRSALAHKAKLLADSKTYGGRGRQAVLADPEGAVFAILASSSGDASDYLASNGEWIWSSLQAKDAGSEAAFYQELFGYDVYDVPTDDGLEHVILSTDDVARASANEHFDKTPHHSHWLNYIRVQDATDLASKAVLLGGKILVQPHPDRHGGMVAVVSDPSGAAVGLMEWTDGDTKAEPR